MTIKILLGILAACLYSQAYASYGCMSPPDIQCINCNPDPCCGKMGGINYCDSSSGRYVCNNGFNSSCYCTRHAVMDLQHVEGCCLWQGGVAEDNPEDKVICRDGRISLVCTSLIEKEKGAAY